MEGFDIVNGLTFTVSEDKLFWLVFAEMVYSVNDCLGHWNFVPTSSNNLLGKGQARKLETALNVATGS
jgi:hypothetical protein